ncbi:unnamed protein product [Nesidiocoris tenuis]|uniref:Uncharacterized protein n=1 Tax=Nesidiocoris tenuis TaxID=355587 RepID=A0A6H5GMH2_9HEMI|nr:unnamed protein product [Nesidiocoris tenuis]
MRNSRANDPRLVGRRSAEALPLGWRLTRSGRRRRRRKGSGRIVLRAALRPPTSSANPKGDSSYRDKHTYQYRKFEKMMRIEPRKWTNLSVLGLKIIVLPCQPWQHEYTVSRICIGRVRGTNDGDGSPTYVASRAPCRPYPQRQLCTPAVRKPITAW